MNELPDFEDPAFNKERIRLQDVMFDAINGLIVHMKGGVPIEMHGMLQGKPYLITIERETPMEKGKLN